MDVNDYLSISALGISMWVQLQATLRNRREARTAEAIERDRSLLAPVERESVIVESAEDAVRVMAVALKEAMATAVRQRNELDTKDRRIRELEDRLRGGA